MTIDKYQYKSLKITNLKKIESKLRNRKELQIAGKLSKKDTYSIQEVQKDDHFSTAYYVPPSKLKKGTFYINTKEPSMWNQKEMIVLSLHEGIPGHHYEAWYMKQRPVPLYIKNTQYDGYSEGWGLYVESLYKTKDPYILYYQSMYNIVRSVRLVVDIGIHMYGWSLSQTVIYEISHI